MIRRNEINGFSSNLANKTHKLIDADIMEPTPIKPLPKSNSKTWKVYSKKPKSTMTIWF